MLLIFLYIPSCIKVVHNIKHLESICNSIANFRTFLNWRDLHNLRTFFTKFNRFLIYIFVDNYAISCFLKKTHETEILAVQDIVVIWLHFLLTSIINATRSCFCPHVCNMTWLKNYSSSYYLLHIICSFFEIQIIIFIFAIYFKKWTIYYQ